MQPYSYIIPHTLDLSCVFQLNKTKQKANLNCIRIQDNKEKEQKQKQKFMASLK